MWHRKVKLVLYDQDADLASYISRVEGVSCDEAARRSLAMRAWMHDAQERGGVVRITVQMPGEAKPRPVRFVA